VVKEPQLRQCVELDKVYVVVVYSRGRQIKNGRRVYACTIEEAYEKALKFFFIPAVDLLKVIRKSGASKRDLIGGRGNEYLLSYWLVSWKAVAEHLGEPVEMGEHLVYGDVPEKPDYDSEVPF